MATVRDLKSQVEELKSLVTGFLCNKSAREPLADAHPDLTGPQIHVIATLANLESPEAIPTMSLAQRMGTSGPTMTGLIDRLERQGLVARERDDEDRRLVRVRLTDEGRQAYAILDAHLTERLRRILDVLDPNDRETFVRLIGHIATALHADKVTEKNVP